MAYIVTDSCIKCKFTDCVAVCPVDCFREGENMLAIEPTECIDCGACVPACPVQAIYQEDDVPDDQKEFIALNKSLSQGWPMINTQKDPLDTSEEFRGQKGKRPLLSDKPFGA